MTRKARRDMNWLRSFEAEMVYAKGKGVEELRVDRSSSENVEKNKFKKVLARISRHERCILDTYLMD